MRCVSRVPAKQLQSAALRYCGVLDRTKLPITPRGRWREFLPVKRASIVAETEDPVARRQRLEAVLLLAREPLHSRKLAQYARLEDGTEARTIIRRLNQLYDEAGRAFRVEEVAGGFRLLTRRPFAPWLRRLEHVPPQVRLSAPAMETLAVVAYRQPVLRAEIEAIRGVNCGEILRQLMERDLVRIGGRSNDLGRPYLYTTTKHFLQLFGLQNLDDLPRAFALRDAGGSTDPTATKLLDAPVSTDAEQQEQEKSEVSVPSPTQLPVDELLEEMASTTAVAPDGAVNSDEFEDEEFVNDDDDDDIDDEEYEEYDDDDDDIDEDFDEDGFEEDEWEEVEDDDEEEWDEEEDEWEDDLEDDVEEDIAEDEEEVADEVEKEVEEVEEKEVEEDEEEWE